MVYFYIFNRQKNIIIFLSTSSHKKLVLTIYSIILTLIFKYINYLGLYFIFIVCSIYYRL